MKHHRAIGVVWTLVFGAGAVLLASQLVVLAVSSDAANYEPSWWVAQAVALAFIFGCSAAGFGLARGARWAVISVRTLGPLALLYLLAYNVFGGERPWWQSVIALVLTAFVAASVFLAYKGPKHNAA